MSKKEQETIDEVINKIQEESTETSNSENIENDTTENSSPTEDESSIDNTENSSPTEDESPIDKTEKPSPTEDESPIDNTENSSPTEDESPIDKTEKKLKPLVEKDDELLQELDKHIPVSNTLFKTKTDQHREEHNDIKKLPSKKWPKYRYTGFDRFLYTIKWITISFLTLAIIGAVAGLGYFYYLMQQTNEITNQNFFVNETSVNIYDINKKFITTLTENNSDWVELCKTPADPETSVADRNNAISQSKEVCQNDDNYAISQFYIDGVISTEDANFYIHTGVDFFGLVKATIQKTFLKIDRGGSTVTMQLGKLLYMDEWIYGPIDPETGLPNNQPLMAKTIAGIIPIGRLDYKLTQMAYALQIEKLYSKEVIFENYMNSVYFGEAGFGIENASKFYYGKSAKDLELHEAAVLAGMPQMPNDFNPYTNPEGTKQRRDIVLEAMLRNEKITQEQHDTAKAMEISQGLVDNTKRVYSDISKYQGYLDIVQNELKNYFPDYDPQSAGLDVYTYLVPELQDQIFTLQNTNDYVYWPDEELQSGLIQIDSQNGAIYAIGSGKEGSSEYRNNYAYNFYRQPGSTSKPLVAYGPGIEYLQWSTWHNFTDKATKYTNGPSVFNAGSQRYEGSLALYAALAKSKNTTAVQALQEVQKELGTDPIKKFMSGLGLSDTGEILNAGTKEEQRALYESYAIGGWMYGTTPYEMAAAYAAFANGGIYNQPHTIDYIEISENSPYYKEYGAKHKFEYDSHRAMQESTAFLITETLRLTNPNAGYYACSQLGHCGGPGIYLDIPDHSAKTGTTDLGSEGRADLAKDKWAIGYTPNITTAVWVGYDENSFSLQNPYGKALDPYSPMADMIYKQTTAFAYNSEYEIMHDAKPMEQPENVEVRYLRANGNNPYYGNQPYYFIKGSDDLQRVDGYTTTEKPNTPVLDASITADTLSLQWGYDGKNRDNAKWSIIIDGKDYKTITDTKISLTMQEITDIGGCSENHDIGVQLIDKNEEGKEIKSDVNTQKITKVSEEYCKK